MAATQVLPDQRGYPAYMSNQPGYQNTELGTHYSPSQYTVPPIPGMAPEASRAYLQVTPTPDVTTENDAYLRLDTYTPDTDVGDIPNEAKPDISLFCDVCSKHIGLRVLREHRSYHRSLEIMSYHHGAFPESVKALKERRLTLLTKLRSKERVDGTVNPSKIQRLNEAYEFLKAELEDTFDAYRRVTEDVDTQVQGLPLNCSTACAPAVAICSHGNNRWKSSMEDTRVFQDYFGNDPNKCFFGLYDGYNGRFAAEVAANELHHFLLLEMEKFDPWTKCTCTFNMAENYDISEYELQEVHSRPTSKCTERGIIHEESTNVIQQIIRTCTERIASLDDDQIDEKTRELDTERKMSAKEQVLASEKKGKRKKNLDPFAEKMGHAFKKAHKSTDFLLSYGKDEMSRVRWSGCSTLACVIQNTQERDGHKDDNKKNCSEDQENIAVPSATDELKDDKSTVEQPKQLGVIHLANAGNVHAVLARANRAYRLTRDHTPDNHREKARILRAGGTINEGGQDLRVNGISRTTRGLGNHGDVGLKRCVITEPSTTSIDIDQYAQFLILATNGVWEVFSEDEAVSILLEVLPSNHIPPPSSLSSSLNYIYEGRRSNSELDSVSSYTAMSSDMVNEGDRLKTTEKSEVKSYKQMSGSGRIKSNVRISDVKTTDALDDSNINRTSSGCESDVVSVDVRRGSLADDMHPEVGSLEAGESGNEADIETDFVTLSMSQSRESARHLNNDQKQRELAKVMSERLVQAALLAGSKDNITVMVILLPACESC